MDGATWVAGLGSAGGVVVSLLSLYKARKAETDQVGLDHIKIALEAQQTLNEKAEERAIAQDIKIERQSARIDEQWDTIKALRREVAACEDTKATQARQIISLQDQITELKRGQTAP